ncbi:MAG: alkaline phosphatase [Thermodesulfobacteriota bacterium]
MEKRNIFRILDRLVMIQLVIGLWFNISMAASTEKRDVDAHTGSKNVIILMADGTGSAHTTITRWYKEAPLNLDAMYLSGLRTYSADSLITDSAPAATAFATGFKSNDDYVGIYPSEASIPGVPSIEKGWEYRPLVTLLEAAKSIGKSVGLVVTSNIQHASPAAYSSHVSSRSNYNEIAKQQVYLDMDVVFGGGKQYLFPASYGGKRTDNEDLIQVLKSRGYAFIEAREDLLSLPSTTPKVWGMFAKDDMAYDFDRRMLAPHQPSLGEMTQKAIEILSCNPEGFFLFVEASKVDWASHANDPVGVISDLLAFDEAVGHALDFARKHPKTLVLAFSDHGNGGMSLGSRKTDKTYSKLKLKALNDPLKKAKFTGDGVEHMLNKDRSEGNIRFLIQRFYGIDSLTGDEVAAIQGAKSGSLNSVIGPMISNRSVIGWTTSGHGGEDLFFYYFGLDRPMTILDNTEIAHLCAVHMDLNLDRLNEEFFIPSEIAFPAAQGFKTHIDTPDPAEGILVVTKDSKTARLPFSKDILLINGKTWEMNGITVYSPKANAGKGRVFVPRQAVEYFNQN